MTHIIWLIIFITALQEAAEPVSSLLRSEDVRKLAADRNRRQRAAYTPRKSQMNSTIGYSTFQHEDQIIYYIVNWVI